MKTYTAPLREDPAWLLDTYLEAKDLLMEIRMDLQYGKATLGPDLAERVEEFHTDTFMDTCTTLGPDCGCNASALVEEAMSPPVRIGSEGHLHRAIVDIAVDAVEAEPWPGEGGWHAFAAQVAPKIADAVLAALGQERRDG